LAVHPTIGHPHSPSRDEVMAGVGSIEELRPPSISWRTASQSRPFILASDFSAAAGGQSSIEMPFHPVVHKLLSSAHYQLLGEHREALRLKKWAGCDARLHQQPRHPLSASLGNQLSNQETPDPLSLMIRRNEQPIELPIGPQVSETDRATAEFCHHGITPAEPLGPSGWVNFVRGPCSHLSGRIITAVHSANRISKQGQQGRCIVWL
jgi:hypothetical protein